MRYFNMQKIQLNKYTLGFEKSIKSHDVPWPSSFLKTVCDLLILILLQSTPTFQLYWNVTCLTCENYSNPIQSLFFCHRFLTTKNRIANRKLAYPSIEVFFGWNEETRKWRVSKLRKCYYQRHILSTCHLLISLAYF